MKSTIIIILIAVAGTAMYIADNIYGIDESGEIVAIKSLSSIVELAILFMFIVIVFLIICMFFMAIRPARESVVVIHVEPGGNLFLADNGKPVRLIGEK